MSVKVAKCDREINYNHILHECTVIHTTIENVVYGAKFVETRMCIFNVVCRIEIKNQLKCVACTRKMFTCFLRNKYSRPYSRHYIHAFALLSRSGVVHVYVRSL